MEEGSALLKDVLVKWKDEVKSGQMSKEEMVARLKELVQKDERLLGNPFFKSVQAL